MSETLLGKATGLTPVGTVIGNGVFVPVITGTPANSAEVSDASRLATKGWETVLARMRERAEEIGAHGIVSIRLERRTVDREAGVTEFCGVGAAVRGLPGKGIWTTEAEPADVYLLRESGYDPVCLAVGCCTWHQSLFPWTPVRQGLGQQVNQEITPATKASYIARAMAMERMQQEARKNGSDGVVGVRIELQHSHGNLSEGFLAGFEAYGTGVVRRLGGLRNPDPLVSVTLK